jgi:hypothetical protein
MKMMMMLFTTTDKSSVAWIMRNLTITSPRTSGVNRVEELCASHVRAQHVAGEKRKGTIPHPNPKLC